MTINLFIVVLAALATPAQGYVNCDVQPTGFYSDCKIDLYIAIDASIAMGNRDNVDALFRSVQTLLSEYVYNGVIRISLSTFGVLGLANCNWELEYSQLCHDLLLLQNSQLLRNYSIFDVLFYYELTVLYHVVNQPVLLLLTAVDNEYDINLAVPIADSLQAEHNVQIITVTVGKTTSEYLPKLATYSFVSPAYKLEQDLIFNIANTSCSDNGVTYLTEASTSATALPATSTVPSYPSTPTPSPPYVNGTDGLPCASNHKQAWLDLVFVIEHSSATFSQWNAITSSIMSTVSQLSLSNTLESGHTSRIALITYDLTGTKVQFNFTAEQTTRNVLIALNKAKPLPNLGAKADIASGLKAAGDYLTANPSFRAPSVVLYAATYDDSNTNDPKTAADGLKTDLIKIATVSFDESNGVNSLKIGKLASPGLDSNTHTPISQLLWAVSQLNCRCARGWSQLTVGTITYADCFFYQDASAFQAFTLCQNTDTDILALASTPARVDFIGQLVSKQKPTDVISIGLSREDNFTQWTWQNVYPYSGYPVFAQAPSNTDVYGYLSKSSSNTWQLLADDGMTTGRFYVCQRQSGDTDNIVEL